MYYPNWSFLLLGNLYNFVWYLEENIQVTVRIRKVILTCYHRNKGEVKYLHVYVQATWVLVINQEIFPTDKFLLSYEVSWLWILAPSPC